MSRLRALVYALLFTLAAFVIWQYHDGGDGDEPARSVLHRGLVTDPESVDPHKARSTQAGDVLRDIGEGLLGYSPTGELVPGAASGWAVSDDGLTFTFTIRENARWSNGDPVTAGHFVYSLRRLVDPATAAFYASLVADIVNARAIIAGELPPEDLVLGQDEGGDLEVGHADRPPVPKGR